MKTHLIALLVLLLLVSGCDFDAPLSSTQNRPIDPAVIGIWTQVDEEGHVGRNPQQVSVLGFSETEYLVIHHANSANAEDLYFRAYPIVVGEQALVQLQLLFDEVPPGHPGIKPTENAAAAQPPEAANIEENRYLVLSYTLLDGKLVVERLNTEVVGEEAGSPEDLQAAFEEHLHDPELFAHKKAYIR